MAMNIAVDANRYVDYCRGLPEVTTVIRTASRIVMPFITLGEIRGGFRHGSRSRENERRLVEWIQAERVEIAFADENTTHIYADLFAMLRRQGTPIPTNDLWIAALVIQNDLILFSRDKHFDAIPHLARL